MVMRKAMALLLALGIPLVACQPAEQEAGGGAGGERQVERPMAVGANPGDRFEEAYTNLAEAHISLVQGDWDAASTNIKEVRENLDGMKPAQGEQMDEAVTSRITRLQQETLGLDQLITNRSPEAVEQSRTLMNTFTRESTLAQVGLEGGGAGTTKKMNR